MGIDKLSAEERLELVHEIWDGLAAHDAAPDHVIPWETAKAEILDRLLTPNDRKI
ncbi:MAG: hypothetical protein ACRC1K_16415 [Planctomycetia bacterium]